MMRKYNYYPKKNSLIVKQKVQLVMLITKIKIKNLIKRVKKNFQKFGLANFVKRNINCSLA